MLIVTITLTGSKSKTQKYDRRDGITKTLPAAMAVKM